MATKQLWFAVAFGRGTATRAVVTGPYSSVAQFNEHAGPNPYITTLVIGDKSGYTSKAGAQAAADAFNHQSVSQRVGAFGGHTGALPSIPNPLSGVDEIGAVLKATFTTLADWHMWASLGWIVVGLVLLVAGIRLWLGKPVLPSMPSVVPVPV